MKTLNIFFGLLLLPILAFGNPPSRFELADSHVLPGQNSVPHETKPYHHKSLPHRKNWELYSIQGLYSKQKCPGQYPYYVQDMNTGMWFFLMCYGHRK